MNFIQIVRSAAVVLVAVGPFIVNASDAIAATPATGQVSAVVSDVALGHGGVLQGQLVNRQGSARAETTVIISKDGKEVARTTTTVWGQFSVPGLRGGVYVISTPASSQVCRLWTAETAPPAAQPGVLLVEDENGVTTRGQIPAAFIGAGAAPTAVAGAVIGGAVGYGVLEFSDAS